MHTLGLVANASSKTRIGYLTYGVDDYHDDVDSFRNNFNAMGAFTGSARPGSRRRRRELRPRRRLRPGRAGAREVLVRRSRAPGSPTPRSTRITSPIPWPETSRSMTSGRTSSAPRASCTGPTECTSFYGSVAQGYRTPNLSDLTRLDVARTNELEVPRSGSIPSTRSNFEVGGRLEGRFSVEGAYYFTLLDDIIIRRPTAHGGAGRRDDRHQGQRRRRARPGHRRRGVVPVQLQLERRA